MRILLLAMLLAVGLESLATASASPFKSAPRVRIERGGVVYGNSQRFHGLGVVDRAKIFEVLPAVKTLRKENPPRSGAKYRFLLVEANEMFRSLVEEAARMAEVDCVAIEGFVRSEGLIPIDLTERVLLLARSKH